MKNIKKTIVTIIVAVLVISCMIGLIVHTTKSKNAATETTTTSSTGTETITDITLPEENAKKATPAEELIAEYRAGTWDGKNRRINGEIYHITKNGCLVANDEDNADSDGGAFFGYPDVPSSIEVGLGFSSTRLDSTNTTLETGTVVINSDFTELFYCVRGEIISSHKLSEKVVKKAKDAEHANVIGFGDCVAVKVGQHLCICNITKNWKEDYIDNAVNAIVDSQGCLMVSTLDNINYSVNGSGKSTRLNSHYIEFPTEDMNMKFVPEADQKSVSTKGQTLFAGVWNANRDNYYLYANKSDKRTYTMYYNNGITSRLVARDVVDAETIIGGCYFITSDGKVYFDDVNGNKSEVHSGTANALVYITTDEVYIATAKKEANAFSTNGWDNLYNLDR